MKHLAAACLMCLTPHGATDSSRPRTVTAVIMPQCPVSGRYDAMILKHAQKHHLNPRLVKSIVAEESGFYFGALSPTGARGLMQLMPMTAEEMGVPRSRLRDPESNLRAGTSYLAVLCGRARIIYGLKKPGCRDAPLWVQERVVAAYHSGPRMLHHAPGQWTPVTRLYVREVFAHYRSPMTALARPPIKVSPKRMQVLLAKL